MVDPRLKDKVILVTGGNHGIGAAIAKAFAEQESLVFITYLRLPLDGAVRQEGDTDTPGEALYRHQQARSGEGLVLFQGDSDISG